MNYRQDGANLKRKEIKEIKRLQAEERNLKTKPENRSKKALQSLHGIPE